ncbi:hotdog domain-containing protein [Nocardia vinacea]|uniref:PaaI family thioesterase n=1 Tax=Nocardia vinacea TaxID=96468 RepID=UPI0034297B17
MFTVHGGVIATLMDTAMGSAVFTKLGDGGRIVGLEDLWGRDATRLRERLHETQSWHE